MKKFMLILSLLTFTLTFSNIVVRDIADFTFSNGNSLNFDFNSDGTTEFTFFDEDGSVSVYYNSNSVNFYGTGTLASGHGWDIIKSLSLNTPINSSSTFDGQGDAFINAPWANPNETFPNGDSYVGTTFKIGTNRYYGWILVNVNAGVIQVKSYAYNDSANQSINAGQTTALSMNDFSGFDFSLYPNPATNFITIKSSETITRAKAIDVTGRTISLNLNDALINTEKLPAGIYILELSSDTNKIAVQKIVKK
ncbi:T9SS type A sorting domain-containing protein [Flavobacterium sp. SM15]|uniref:T9SS type A sorting domain-containing protein n=1 Tax=Flavobacterium sp. SM15 TaxID=2908005 RepID=UPI001EDA05BF|nr:T9SS type A sorting domain-containing protein [Flavobacterium sp. SM15]MCG2610395.1 T9SS type A sorting domain-containing protein [Flavobacterium sp. SM15]